MFIAEVGDAITNCSITRYSKEKEAEELRALIETAMPSTLTAEEQESHQKNQNNLRILELELDQLPHKELKEYSKRMTEVCVSFQHIADYSVYTQYHIF